MSFSSFSFPSEEQIISLADRLRPSDRRELLASHVKQDPVKCLKLFVKHSCRLCVLTTEEGTAAIGGIAADRTCPGAACVWLLTATAVEKYPKTFFKICRREVTSYLEQYDVLYNWVDARYTQAVRFISRLGGEFDATYRLCAGHKFLFFTFRRK
jgi:hypothetical protein